MTLRRKVFLETSVYYIFARIHNRHDYNQQPFQLSRSMDGYCIVGKMHHKYDIFIRKLSTEFNLNNIYYFRIVYDERYIKYSDGFSISMNNHIMTIDEFAFDENGIMCDA